jgi:hypothetical protein
MIGGSAEIHLGKLMELWIYYEKFLMDMRLLFRTLPFMTGKYDNL